MSAYHHTFATAERRARRALGMPARVTQGGMALALLLAGVPAFRAVFMPFLGAPGVPDADVAAGLAAVWWRLALFVMAMVGLSVHGRVLRGEARQVLSLHPVDPAQVVWATLRRVAVDRLDLLVVCAVWLAPVGVTVGVGAWLRGLGVVVGAWFAAIPLSTVVLLGAIRVAESPAWAPLLDQVRGSNPRAQAAIIWSLMPSTLVIGALAGMAAQSAAAGSTLAWLGWGLAPLVVGLMAMAAVGPLATQAWFPATAVLSEIRARYDAVERPEEAQAVYGEWVLRGLPEGAARWALLELRHGWRAARTWVSATWLFAIGALWSGWTTEPAGAWWAAVVAGAGAWTVGFVPLLGAVAEAPFFRLWLRGTARDRGLARVAVVGAWSVAPAAAAVLAVVVRQGWGQAAWTAGIVTVLVGMAGVGSGLTARLAERGRVPYATAGAALVGATAWMAAAGGGA